MISGDMAGKDIVQAIKNKEMDRKDFLKYSGLVLLILVGLRAITMLLEQDQMTNKVLTDSKSESSRGFGGGKYGA